MDRTNHIDPELSEQDLKTIQEYLRTCEENEEVCYQSGKKYARRKRILSFVSGLFVATGVGTTAAVGPIGVPIVGGAVFCLAFAEKMNWGKKADHCKMIGSEFSELIEDLISCRRGTKKFVHLEFSTDLRKVENMMNKNCMRMTKTREAYRRKKFPARYPNKK